MNGTPPAPTPTPTPWGLTRMRAFPETVVLAPARVVLDADSQTGRWQRLDDSELPVLDRHKRSETSSETKVLTSADGNSDQGSDQEGDTD
ncbi:putative ATP-grasp-modified RiPP [Streptomyces sp. NPDC052496]|uniref:putative ATP-grasp-modified RiPP n=1 Tax=Streptomyces sp. NPDC052496 TaxID=3154951 RepID=UPI00341DEC35